MDDRARLLELLTRLAYEKRKVVLSSGRESDFYIDTKQVSLSAEGHYLIGRLVLAADSRWSIDLEIRLYRQRERIGGAAEAFWQAATSNAASHARGQAVDSSSRRRD